MIEKYSNATNLASFFALCISLVLSPTTAWCQDDATKEQPFPVPMKLVLKMLNRAEVQKELELDGNQTQQVSELAREHSMAVQKARQSVKPLPISNEDEFNANMKELNKEHTRVELETDILFAKKLEEILVEFQRQRVSQMGVQLVYAKPVFVSVFKTKQVADAAKLNDDESGKLFGVASIAESDYLRELRALKEKYHKKVRQSMDMEVRTAIEEVLGEPYVSVPKISLEKPKSK